MPVGQAALFLLLAFERGARLASDLHGHADVAVHIVLCRHHHACPQQHAPDSFRKNLSGLALGLLRTGWKHACKDDDGADEVT